MVEGYLKNLQMGSAVRRALFRLSAVCGKYEAACFSAVPLEDVLEVEALPGDRGKAPIIAMSADALPRQVERCYAAGMVDHIAKPIQREVLYAKIERWIGRRGGAEGLSSPK